MIALIQRVSRAEVAVDERSVGQIGPGLLVFVCAEPGDDEAIADRLVAKILKLRVFADAAGKMNRSLKDVQGGLLLVSQFTLAADVSGRSEAPAQLCSEGLSLSRLLCAIA